MNSKDLEESNNVQVEQDSSISSNIDIDEITATGKNLIKIEELEEQELAANPESNLEEQIQNNMLKNVTLADAEIKMFGDRTILAQIAQLIAYIRYAIKNNQQTEIKLLICKSDNTVADAEFMFDLNGCQVPDLVPQSEIFIN
jgi:hypothetical protein